MKNMDNLVNRSGRYMFDGIGVVQVNVRSTSRTVRARWKGGEVVVSAPTGIAYDKLQGILRDFAPRLQECRPETPYQIGQTFGFDGMEVTLMRQTRDPKRIFAAFDGTKGRIEVGEEWEMAASATIRAISRFLCRMAQNCAEAVLIPRARQVAREIGREPKQWTISNGHRTLGRCDSRGVIALSYSLMFYPTELRDYVVKHELAHLSEMNHSPRFHHLCDTYCGGHEKELEAKLRAYRAPVVR